MSYRNITVDGKNYQYVIGKTHTKIKDIGVFKNTDIGEVVQITQYCECCGEPLSALYSSHSDPRHICVKPSHVARQIAAGIQAIG